MRAQNKVNFLSSSCHRRSQGVQWVRVYAQPPKSEKKVGRNL